MNQNTSIWQWDDLPNPSGGGRLALRCSAASWTHFREKHVTCAHERDCWSGWLGEDVLNALTRPADQTDPQALARAGETIHAAILKCLNAPLLIAYHVGLKAGAVPQWKLILPCGAVAVARFPASDGFLVTCYFPSYARDLNPDRRWRMLVNHAIWRFTILDRQAGFVAPGPADTVLIGRPPVRHTRIRFVSEANWGFRIVHDKHVWRPRWTAYAPTGAVRAHRLLPRRPDASAEQGER